LTSTLDPFRLKHYCMVLSARFFSGYLNFKLHFLVVCSVRWGWFIFILLDSAMLGGARH